jgi:hypothetical protein
MMGDTRPKWDFKLSETKVRKLSSDVKSITHHWGLTGTDTARDWVEFHGTDGSKFVAPHGWQEFFEFKPDHRGLIQPNHRGKEAIKVLHAIDAWKGQNAADLAELDRLHKKLGISASPKKESE